MMKKTILVLGNLIVKEDNHALRLLPALGKTFPCINFVKFDPTEEIPENAGSELLIIDTADGIKKVAIFDNLKRFKISPRITPHDFDLPVNLGIMMKLKKIKKVTIIAVPQCGKNNIILADINKILTQLQNLLLSKRC